MLQGIHYILLVLSPLQYVCLRGPHAQATSLLPPFQVHRSVLITRHLPASTHKALLLKTAASLHACLDCHSTTTQPHERFHALNAVNRPASCPV